MAIQKLELQQKLCFFISFLTLWPQIWVLAMAVGTLNCWYYIIFVVSCILHLSLFVYICVTLICWESDLVMEGTQWRSRGPATPLLTWHGGQQGKSASRQVETYHGNQMCQMWHIWHNGDASNVTVAHRCTLEPSPWSFGASLLTTSWQIKLRSSLTDQVSPVPLCSFMFLWDF